jgi:predicted transcriptional regulator
MYILKKNKVIPDVRELEDGVIEVMFFSIQHTDDEAKVISLASEKGLISLEEVVSQLNWSQDRAIRALTSLEKSGFAKKDESYLKGKKWYFPSIS